MAKQPLRLMRRFFSESMQSEVVKTEGANVHQPGMTLQYINNELVEVNQIVLRTRNSMEEYVMKIVKDYFRTSQLDALDMHSNLADHGLDSLDCAELVMTMESDLGYLVPSENIPGFQKPIHFVNYIEQVENFKQTYNKNPMP